MIPPVTPLFSPEQKTSLLKQRYMFHHRVSRRWKRPADLAGCFWSAFKEVENPPSSRVGERQSAEKQLARASKPCRVVAAFMLPYSLTAGTPVRAFFPRWLFEESNPMPLFTLRAGSYNVFGGRMADALPIGHALSELNLDVLGLQECPDDDFAQAIAKGCGMHYAFAGGKMVASRQPLDDVREIELVAGRSVLRCVTLLDGIEIALDCAHISWDENGDKDARKIIDDVVPAENVERMVLMGDWNDEHYSTQIDILEESLSNCWTDLGWRPGERISWPSYGWYDSEGGQLIDMVFVNRDSGGRAVAGDVVNLTPVLSDHKPIWADIAFPDPVSIPIPKMSRAYVLDASNIEIEFDRRVDLASARNVTNYEILFQGIETPVKSAQLSPHGTIVRLTTAGLTVGRTYLLNAKNILADGRGVRVASIINDIIRVDRNLLTDPTADDGVEGWECSGGFSAVSARENQEPYVGDAMFTGGASDLFSQALQIVDLSDRKTAVDRGRVLAAVQGFMCTGYQREGTASRCEPDDEGEIFVEMLGQGGERLWWRTSGLWDTLWWHRFDDRFPVVPGTRLMRLYLRSYRKEENGPSNDACFDAVSLSLAEMDVPGSPLGGDLIKNGLAETGDTSGWTTDGDFHVLESYTPQDDDELKALALSGSFLFRAGRGSPVSQACQTVDLKRYEAHIDRRNLVIQWGASCRSWFGEATAEVSIACLDGGGGILEVASTGRYSGAEWLSHIDRMPVPPGTRSAVITLRARMPQESPREMGAYFDGIYALPTKR